MNRSPKKKVKTIISKYIAILCSQLKIKQPECNYKSSRKEYLNLIKKKKKKVSEVKIAKRMLLYYLNRDIQTFVKLISASTERFDLFMRKERNIVGSIIKMYHQQMEMLQEGTNQCANRIISIFQPHIRPIVRGKAKAKVEFGAKIGAGIINGYQTLQRTFRLSSRHCAVRQDLHEQSEQTTFEPNCPTRLQAG